MLVLLTQNQHAEIDPEDWDKVKDYKWYAAWSNLSKTFYAQTTARINGKRCTIRMHQLIMNSKKIDHIDHNGLNNLKSNLRLTTNQGNSANKRKSSNHTSLHKGVSWYPRYSKWLALICVNYKRIHLGYFHTEIEAAKAYNQAAIQHFGEFAHLNTIP